jgi:hypothetical protein
MTSTFRITHLTHWYPCFCQWVFWFSLESSHFEATKLLFQDEAKEADAPLQECYCTQLSELFTQYADELKQFICVDHHENTDMAFVKEVCGKVLQKYHLVLCVLHQYLQLPQGTSGVSVAF